MNPSIPRVLLVLAVCVLAWMPAAAAVTAEEVFPPQPDPLVGDYAGRWSDEEEVAPEIAAQVIALGQDTYRIRLVNKLDMRCPVLLEVETKAENGSLSFKERNLYGECDGATFTGGRGRGKFKFSMTKTTRKPPTLGAKPPEGATVLFDGSTLDAWKGTEGWKILDNGVLMVTPDGEYLTSKGAWRDVKLHVEFRLPFMPRSSGQARGNSGVFLQDVYEVQVLDSYGLDGYFNECGALYKLSAPHVNACAPPLEWQTYDIEYRAPRYDAAGKLQEYGRITVLHNGVLIHNQQELTWITAWKEVERKAAPPKKPGPIKLQGHNNFVQFRNIWLVDRSK